jgi:1-phosphofructokinase family hexose kinase
MIVTVTPNTAIDRTLIVPSFSLNRTIRASRSVMGMGGKATDASWILGELGIPSLALGFAAGLAGQQVEAMLRERGVDTDFVWVGGETRSNTVIVCEDGSGQSTVGAATLEVSAEHVDALQDRYQAALEDATCVVMGGSLPRSLEPSLYTRFAREARRRDIPVVFDASGPGLRAGLSGRPTFVKPNRAELEEITGQPAPSVEAAYHAARKLQARYGTSLVVTLGEEGAVAVLPGRAYRIPPPQVEVVSTAGAGDGVLAGLAVALSRGEPLEEGLRLGFAAAGAVLTTLGTADCRRADVERLLPTIELVPYHPPPRGQMPRERSR